MHLPPVFISYFHLFILSLIINYTLYVWYDNYRISRTIKCQEQEKKDRWKRGPSIPEKRTKDVTPPLLAPIATLVVPSFLPHLFPYFLTYTIILLLSCTYYCSCNLLPFNYNETGSRGWRKRIMMKKGEGIRTLRAIELSMLGHGWSRSEDESDLITIHSQHSSSSVSQKLLLLSSLSLSPSNNRTLISKKREGE